MIKIIDCCLGQLEHKAAKTENKSVFKDIYLTLCSHVPMTFSSLGVIVFKAGVHLKTLTSLQTLRNEKAVPLVSKAKIKKVFYK